MFSVVLSVKSCGDKWDIIPYGGQIILIYVSINGGIVNPYKMDSFTLD